MEQHCEPTSLGLETKRNDYEHLGAPRLDKHMARSVCDDLEAWTCNSLCVLNEKIIRSSGDNSPLQQLIREGAELAEQCHAVLTNVSRLDQKTGLGVVGNLGMFVSSCVRHGIAVSDPRLSSTLEVLSALAAVHQHPPRESLYTYVLYNEPNLEGRFKSFTQTEDEQQFIRLTKIAVGASNSARDAVARVDLSNPQEAEALLRAAKLAMTQYKTTLVHFLRPSGLEAALVSPDVFYDHFRQFPSLEIGGIKYGPPSAAYAGSIMELDLRLGLTDPFQRQHTQARLAYFLAPERQLLEQALQTPPLLSNLLGDSMEDPYPKAVRQQLIERNLLGVAAEFINVCDEFAAASSVHGGLIRNYLIRPKATRAGESSEGYGTDDSHGCPFSKKAMVVDPTLGASGMTFEQVAHLKELRKSAQGLAVLRRALEN